MGLFKLGAMTLSGLFGKPATRKYPFEKREPYARTRGRIEMADMKGCILCGLCSTRCPALCIEVDKQAETWTYWPYKCIACDSCVRACPKGVLAMQPDHVQVAVDMESVVCVKPPLFPEEQAEKERKEAERAAKVAAAKAKKAAAAGASGAAAAGASGAAAQKQGDASAASAPATSGAGADANAKD